MNTRGWSLAATAAAIIAVLGLHIVWPQPGPEGYWFWALGLMAFPVAAALILARRPGNGVGRALGVVALASMVIFATWWFVGQAPRAPSSAWAELLHAVAVMPQFGGMVALLYVFPTGRPLNSRHRRALRAFVWLLAAAALVWLLSPGPLPLTGRPNPAGFLPAWTRSVVETDGGWDVVVAVFAVLGLASLALRWRRAGAEERTQLRWFIAAAVLVVATVASLDAVEAALPEDDATGLLGAVRGLVIAAALYWSLPAAVVVAVTRYRLYEIDRLISRTVTYALVVMVLAGVYVGGVLLVGFLLPLQSELAVAVSTLAAAALFNPLRQRVQERVDRRFNRARYDADRVVDGFRVRLRDEVDLDDLTGDLLAVVTATVQPAGASLWLRADER